MISFVTPRKGKPPGSISATDLAFFSMCPRLFLYRKIFSQKPTRRMIDGAKAHAHKYVEHLKRSTMKIPIGAAVEIAAQGEQLIGREVEVWGNGIYGIIDEIRLWGNSAVIIDYKSNISEFAKIQVLSYAYALQHMGVENIDVKLVRTDDGFPLWTERFDQDAFSLIDRLKRAFLNTVREGTFPRAAHPSLCERCPFYHLCNSSNR